MSCFTILLGKFEKFYSRYAQFGVGEKPYEEIEMFSF